MQRTPAFRKEVCLGIPIVAAAHPTSRGGAVVRDSSTSSSQMITEDLSDGSRTLSRATNHDSSDESSEAEE